MIFSSGGSGASSGTLWNVIGQEILFSFGWAGASNRSLPVTVSGGAFAQCPRSKGEYGEITVLFESNTTVILLSSSNQFRTFLLHSNPPTLAYRPQLPSDQSPFVKADRGRLEKKMHTGGNKSKKYAFLI